MCVNYVDNLGTKIYLNRVKITYYNNIIFNQNKLNIHIFCVILEY